MKDKLLREIALSYLSVPYRWGGNSPLIGFDCSGFICEMLKVQGLLYHRSDLTAQGIYNYLTYRDWKESVVSEIGDIAFYGSDLKKIRHCAMAIGDELIIEAGGGDKSVKNLEAAKAKDARVKIRQIDYRTDYLICLTLPKPL